MTGGRTIELDEALAARLDGAAGAAGVSRPVLAAAAIEEWLRMERHPGASATARRGGAPPSTTGRTSGS